MAAPDRPSALASERETILVCAGRAVALAALLGAVAGCVEALVEMAQQRPRYPQWQAVFSGVAVAGNAALAAALALPAALFALLLWRPAEHHSAPPSACAALGAALGLAAWIAFEQVGTALLLPAALAGTLLALALRELLAWWPLHRAWTLWLGALALGLAVQILIAIWVDRRALGGSWVDPSSLPLERLGAWVLAVGAVVLLLASLRSSKRRRGLLLGAVVLGAADLAVLALVPFPSVPASSDFPGGVVLISIDTLRADRLGCYGAQGARTPAIDSLARDGVLFENATSQANTTGPSHATMLTGLLPIEHGAVSNGRRLRGSAPTLADLLRAHGSASAAFVSGFTLQDRACGLASRFDWYDDNLLAWTWMPQDCERLRIVEGAIHVAERFDREIARAERPAAETVDRVLRWLQRAMYRDLSNYFLFVHIYDPHAPYEPPPEHAPSPPDAAGVPHYDWYELDTGERRALVSDERTRAHMEALYASEVAYADAQVGRLLQAIPRNAIVILTSDHGEGLGAHGYFYDHGTFLYDEELCVPLIMRIPPGDRAGVRVSSQVRLVDLAPTVMELVRRQSKEPMSGASLLSLIEGTESRERPSFAISDVAGSLSGFPLDGRRISLRAEGHKLVWTSEYWLDTERVPERWELYDLSRDPGELHPLRPEGPGAEPELFRKLKERLEAFREAAEKAGGDADLPEDVLRGLRALGYL